MPNHFSERFKKRPDNELAKIVETPKKYQPEAVEAAIEELTNRRNGTSQYFDLRIVQEERRRLAEQENRTKKAKSKQSFRFVKSFLRLVLKPDTHRIRTTTSNRLLLTLRFYFLTLLFLIVSSIPLLILEEFGLVTHPEQFDVVPAFFDDSSDIALASLLIPVLAGLFEESQFRLVLHKFNKKYFDIFISLFASHLITKLFGQFFLTYTEFYSVFLLQSTLIYLVFAIPIYFSLSHSNAHSSWFERNWSFTYKYLFYALAFLFAVGHLPTIDLTLEHLIFWPLVILPFFIYTLTFSYVRIRIGFQYAVLLHFTIDLIAIMAQK